jgi:O-antigen ligase
MEINVIINETYLSQFWRQHFNEKLSIKSTIVNLAILLLVFFCLGGSKGFTIYSNCAFVYIIIYILCCVANMELKSNPRIYYGSLIIYIAFIAIQMTAINVSNANILDTILQFSLYGIITLLPVRLSLYRSTYNIIKPVALFYAAFIIVSSILKNNFITIFDFYFTNVGRLLHEYSAGQYSGLNGARGLAAASMNIAMCYFISGILSQGKIKLKQMVYCTICFAAMLCTGQRSQVIIIVCVVFIMLFFLSDRKIRKSILRFFLIFSIITIAILIFVPQANITIQRFTSLNDYSTLNGRLDLWQYAIQLFKQKPIFGNGLGSFSNLNSLYGQGSVNEAHNMYLQLLAETGLVGSVLYFSFFICCLIICFKAVKVCKYYRELLPMSLFSLMVCITFLIHGMVSFPIYIMNEGIILSICVGMSLSIIRKRLVK